MYKKRKNNFTDGNKKINYHWPLTQKKCLSTSTIKNVKCVIQNMEEKNIFSSFFFHCAYLFSLFFFLIVCMSDWVIYILWVSRVIRKQSYGKLKMRGEWKGEWVKRAVLKLFLIFNLFLFLIIIFVGS